jgi:hypothetical protein
MHNLVNRLEASWENWELPQFGIFGEECARIAAEFPVFLKFEKLGTLIQLILLGPKEFL